MDEPNEQKSNLKANSEGTDRVSAARPLFSRTLPPKSTRELQYYAGRSKSKSEEDRKSGPATTESDSAQGNREPEARRASKPKFLPVSLDFWKVPSDAKPRDESNSAVLATAPVKPSSYEPSPKPPRSPTDALLDSGLESMMEATNIDRQARDEGVDDEERAARIDESNARLEDEAELRSEREAEEKERWEDGYDREGFDREHKKTRRKEEWKY